MKFKIRVLFGLLLVTLVSTFICSCGTTAKEDWSKIIIGENLPTPQKGKLDFGSNLSDWFSGAIENVSEEYYYEYKSACIEQGYIIDSEDTGTMYQGFNESGYELSLHFSGGKIHIILQAPIELSEMEWPNTELASMLPPTESKLAKITSDSSITFRITVGETTLDGYNSYVERCRESGFVVDYLKNERTYDAKNEDGYRLYVEYLGCNRIDIMLQIPEETVNTDSLSETDETDATETTDISTSKTESSDVAQTTSGDDNVGIQISKEFKEAMDSYESFFDEYVRFMKKYKASSGTDLSLISDYAKYLSDYSKLMIEFEQWGSKEMTNAEVAYYLQVQSRITAKLLEIAE